MRRQVNDWGTSMRHRMGGEAPPVPHRGRLRSNSTPEEEETTMCLISSSVFTGIDKIYFENL